jgi:hypothetical protein
MIKVMSAIVVFLAFSFAAVAQSPAQNWNSVKTLPVGTAIRISVGSRIVNGDVQSVADDSLAVNSGKGQEMFMRQEVTRLAVKKKGHRLRNSMIGLGIGTGAGIGIGLGVGHANDCSSGFLCGIDTAAGGALGGAIGLVGGTIVGALWPTGGWREVYKQ